MSFLFFLLKASRLRFAAVILTGLLGGLCASGLVAILHRGLNGGLESHYGFLLGAFILLWFGYGIFTVLATYLVARLTEKSIFDIRLGISRQLLRVPYPFIEQKKSQLLAILTTDINTVAAGVERLSSVIVGLATILGVLGYLITLSPLFLGIVLAILFLGVWVYWLPLKHFRRHMDRIRESWNNLFLHFEGLIMGAKELQLHRARREAYLEKEIVATSQRQMDLTIRGKTLEVLMKRWGELYLLIGLGFLLFSVPFWSGVTVLDLSQFVLVSLFLLAPLSTVAGFTTEVERVNVALKHIQLTGRNLEQTVRGFSAKTAEAEAVLPANPRVIHLNKVTYSYAAHGASPEAGDFTLGPIDLKLAPGEILFLTGGNGSGKTTLAKTICGLYPHSGGSIQVGEVEVDDEQRSVYREYFSTVFSDFYLFQTLHGIPEDFLQEEANRIIRELRLDSVINLRDRRISSLNLSSGQRKRLALLVACLENRPFLVLDEWAAEQDVSFKNTFYRELVPGFKQLGKGVIVISHDDRFFHLADRLVTLEEGKIKEDSAPPVS